MNILFTCAGRRNYLINYFKDVLNGDGKIVAADMQLSAPALVDADIAIEVPSVYDADYIPKLLEICQKYQVKGLISLNDLELPILGSNISRFESIGTKVIIASNCAIDICFDKWETVQFCKEHNINTPLTFKSEANARDAIQKGLLKFPLVIKPRWGSASIGIEFPDSFDELELTYRLLKIKLDKTILAKASNQDFENSILIQEKIDGREFGLDILNDFNGSTVAVYVKEKLAMRAGETDKAVLRNNPELEELGYKIGNALGHIGNLDCDLFERNGEFYLLEMNPRFGGGYPFTHMAGGNYPAAIIAWLKGENYDINQFKREYDQPYAKCDRMIKVMT